VISYCRFGMQIVKNCQIHESTKPNSAKVILNNSAEILAVFPHMNSEDFRERSGWFGMWNYVDFRNQVIIKKCE
jgi:hypothetical protein